MDLYENVLESAYYLKKQFASELDLAVVLGSGLSEAKAKFTLEAALPYEQIPHFPVSGVEGHPGQLLLTKVAQKNVAIMLGRFHYYEGYTMKGITFPIRVLAQLGIKQLILTCAAGGLNKRLRPGDFMLVTDHLNFMGDNPLIGVNDERLGPRFLNLQQIYSERLLSIAEKTASLFHFNWHRGVLAAMSGPSYETPAEASFLHHSGAQAVTMSTVPEAIVAAHCGLELLAISCISNNLMLADKTTHNQVLKVMQSQAPTLGLWLKEIITQI